MSNGQAVLVVGDVMLDERIEGEMTRISPEAPSPVVKATSITHMLGGAGNVAAGIAALGHRVFLLGAAAHDSNGQLLRNACDLHGLHINFWPLAGQTTTKTRITCGGQQVMRYDQETTSQPTQEQLDYMVAALTRVMQPQYQLGMVVVSDYLKGVVTAELMGHIRGLANMLQIPVYVDGKPRGLPLYEGCALYKPNFREAMEAAEYHVHPGLYSSDPVDRALTAASVLRRYHSFGTVVVTMGAAGAACDTASGSFHSSLPPQECFDVTGAGDTFMAALADAYLAGMPIDAAVLQANTAAAAAVTRRGTHVLTREELENAIHARRGPSGKIMTLEQAVRLASQKRASKNARVVLTNGTFRFLHHGHMELLQFAKQQGDLLIVAINSDRAIEQLKPGKRFIPQRYRAELLSQFPCVDAVVVFDDVNAEALVRAINPLILVKGAEYIQTSVPGADWVARHGGELRFAPMVREIHATDLA